MSAPGRARRYAPLAKPRRRAGARVWFADAVLPQEFVTVHRLPPADRGMEAGFVERMQRVRALRDVHGIAVGRRAVDAEFGEDGRPGARGTYAAHMARKNLWHKSVHGRGWYRADAAADGRVRFARVAAPGPRLIADMARDYLATGRPDFFPGRRMS